MPLTFEELREEALTLPIHQRLGLADELYYSADHGDTEANGELALHPDWPAELAHRAEDIRSGRVKMIPGEEVHREIDELIDAL